MMRTAALFLLLATASGGSNVGRNQGFLGLRADMRPDVVAKTLARVEQEWNDETAAFLDCNATRAPQGGEQPADCTPANFQKSCPTVVGAILKSSSGNRGVPLEGFPELPTESGSESGSGVISAEAARLLAAGRGRARD